MKEILRLIEEHKVVNTAEELETVLSKLNHILENEFFLLGLSLDPMLKEGRTIIIDNYPNEWRKQYDEAGFMYIDPIVKYSMNNALPVFWDSIRERDNSGKVLFEEARISGLKAGISIPIHGLKGEFGMLSFATSDTKSFTANNDNLVLSQLVVPLITQNIERITQTIDHLKPSVALTNREIQCLSWAAEGKSAWEIATILGCSERTAKFHISNACQKLGATNRYQAITKAILGGYIDPQL
ncbi:helix-turn-helix transcriptional regulator [Vibrio sp. TRT 21S02]|uniref:helix-turn-helix transcriptional regulator n=1 Tax=unclassified Vibrio TaxID=2614977 RepID=UPI00349FA0AA